jgi:antitoxin (DNA-binding transcriptional repressor) of toxin-antitoxin stability system
VASGDEEVVIASAGTPLVKMVAYAPPSTPREPGLLRGKIVIKPGFDELPPGFDELPPGFEEIAGQ